jgi:hypothetical protein
MFLYLSRINWTHWSRKAKNQKMKLVDARTIALLLIVAALVSL